MAQTALHSGFCLRNRSKPSRERGRTGNREELLAVHAYQLKCLIWAFFVGVSTPDRHALVIQMRAMREDSVKRRRSSLRLGSLTPARRSFERRQQLTGAGLYPAPVGQNNVHRLLNPSFRLPNSPIAAA